jgi:hypothetical protein
MSERSRVAQRSPDLREITAAQPSREAGQRRSDLVCARQLREEERLQRAVGAQGLADSPRQAGQVGAQIEAIDQTGEGREVAPLVQAPAEGHWRRSQRLEQPGQDRLEEIDASISQARAEETGNLLVARVGVAAHQLDRVLLDALDDGRPGSESIQQGLELLRSRRGEDAVMARH